MTFLTPYPSPEPPRGQHAADTCEDGPRGPVLIGLAVDDTIVSDGQEQVAPILADAMHAVVAAGHHLVLVTDRPLTGLLPVVASCGLTSGWMITSTGLITARIAADLPGGYELRDAHLLNVRSLANHAVELMPDIAIATEEPGWGYLITQPFAPGHLTGRQRPVPDPDGLPSHTPHLVLHGAGASNLLARPLRALDPTVRVTVTSPNRLDLTPGGHSKATTMEDLRRHLSVPISDTVAIGARLTDIPMLYWAGRAIAMNDAHERVRCAADATTTSFDEHGAAPILEALARTSSPGPDVHRQPHALPSSRCR